MRKVFKGATLGSQQKPQWGRRAKVQAEPPQPETEITVVDEHPSVCEAVVDDQVKQKERRGRRAKPAAEPSLEPKNHNSEECVRENETG